MPWTDGVAKQVLPNGLTLLVQRDASAPVVAVVTHVKAGYFDEPDAWVGIAHVLEHMYFKGTARRKPGDIARETQLVGGYINAGTIYDKTIYYTVLPSAAGGLERALDVQADALMHSALDGEELRRELEVIIQEAKRKLDTPGAVATEGLYALLYRVHRMRRWRIGTEEGLRRLTRDDLQAYYTTRYTPSRVIVGIAGAVDVERALHLAAEVYGTWGRPAAHVEGSPPETGDPPPALRVECGDVERPLVNVGWRTVGTLHPDAAALDMAATILGAGRGSRLYRDVRTPGLAASAGAGHYTPTEVGVLELALEGEAERLDAALERSLELVQALRVEGPAAAELDRARALVATQWARRFESMDGRASMLCEAEALGEYRLADELYRRDMAVTGADVRRVAERYLDPAGASGFFYLAEGGTTRFEGAWPWSGGAAAGATCVATPPAMAGGSAPPHGGPTRYPGGVVHYAYPGADVLVRSKRGAGLATVLLHVPGVTTQETDANAGISWLLARTALRGAGGLAAEELAQAAETLGGGLAPSVGVETLGWGMTVRVAAARDAAQLLRLVALQPDLRDEDVALERALQASDARRVRDDMFRHPLQRALAQAFPGDAYGLPALGEPEVVSALDAPAVREWAARVAGGRAVIVGVGDLEAEELHAALEPLAAWPVGEVRPEDREDAPGWTAGRAHETRRKEQSALAMAFPAAAYASADRYPVTVLAALLSGLAGRLFDELREKRSLAYTVAVVPWLARRAGSILSYIATSPERETEAREAMLAELRRVAVEPPSAAELERARSYAAGLEEVRQQSGRAVAAELLEAWVQGAIAELHETAARLRAVTVDDVVRVARNAFDPDRRAEYVVRGGE